MRGIHPGLEIEKTDFFFSSWQSGQKASHWSSYVPYKSTEWLPSNYRTLCLLLLCNRFYEFSLAQWRKGKKKKEAGQILFMHVVLRLRNLNSKWEEIGKAGWWEGAEQLIPTLFDLQKPTGQKLQAFQSHTGSDCMYSQPVSDSNEGFLTFILQTGTLYNDIIRHKD